MDTAHKTLWVGNLPDDITDELLYELFLQAGPLEKVHVPKEKHYAFIQFKHQESVPYSLRIMDGISLFGKMLNMRPRTGSAHDSPTPPVFNRNSQDTRRMENTSNRGSSPYDSSYPKNYDHQQQNANSSSSSNYGNSSVNYNQQWAMQHQGSLPNMQPSSGRRNQRRHHDSAQPSRSPHSDFKGSQSSFRHEPYRRY